MSRIGRLPVVVPAGVTVEIAEGNKVTVKGPKGTLVRDLAPEMEIKVEDGHVVVTRPNDLKRMKSLHGLTRTLYYHKNYLRKILFRCVGGIIEGSATISSINASVS